MSNIGVIVLNQARINPQPALCAPRLQIEDNIGEAIHIHWRNLRLDFSIRDFLALSKGLEEAVHSLPDFLKNQHSEVGDSYNRAPSGSNASVGQHQVSLDPAFSRRMGNIAHHIDHGEIEEVYLDDLLCITYLDRPPYGWKPSPICESKPYLCLQGEVGDYELYADVMGEKHHSAENLFVLKESIEKHGYPYQNNLIVLFGDEPFIRDGQHRAAVLRSVKGNIKIPVLRIIFEEGYDGWRMQPVLKKGRTFGVMRDKEIRNVLCVRTDSIGDAVLSLSMIPHIREKYPGASIHVVCQEHIREVYEPCPFVDSIITFDRLRAYQNQAYRSGLIKKIRALEPDLALNTVFSREPITDFLTLESGAKEMIAFQGDLGNAAMTPEIQKKHNRLYTHIVGGDHSRKPELERNRAFLKKVGIDTPSLKPLIWTHPEDEQFAESFLREKGFQHERTIALFSGAQGQLRWYDQYGTALSDICSEGQLKVIALGGPHEYDFNDKTLKALSVEHFNLCGKTTIRQAAALLSRCRLAVGSETSLAHIACAVDTPNVIMVGGGFFGRFMPYSPLTTILCMPLECYGCCWQCKYTIPYCIRGITPETISASVRLALEKPCEKPRVMIQSEMSWRPDLGRPRWRSCENFLDLKAFEVITLPYSGTGESRASDQHSRAVELNEQGELMFAHEQPEKAFRAFHEALGVNPNFAPAHNNLAVLYWHAGDIRTALKYFGQAMEANPDDRDTILNCGELLKSLNRNDEARKVFSAYLIGHSEDQEVARILADL